MSEEREQHDAQTRGSLYQIAVALAHLWLTNAVVRVRRLPTRSHFWIYPTSFYLPWGGELLIGKRIRVIIEIEDLSNV